MFRNRRVYAVIVAGGRGTRMKALKPKQFLYIGGKTILEKTVDKFRRSSLVDEIIVVTAQDYLEQTEELFRGFSKSMSIISGGERRQDSVANALKLLRQKKVSDDDIVLIHDGVRPYIELDIIASVTKEASEAGAAIPCIMPKDTIRDINKGTLERSDLRCVQTPQGFSAGLLMDAYAKAFTDGSDFTDDAGIVEAFGHKVSLVKGSEDNIKITTPEDVVLETRIGKGFDVHRLVEGRKLILGGVDIPYEKGLLGHSDADVLLHALIDAILGAASMGDIGRLFPDTDPAFKDASSLVLLERAWNAVKYRGYDFINADITVICERPKLAPHIDKMEDNICNVLNISRERINIKATTTEKLGFTGRGEGIAAEAVCILSCSPK
jgi:ygbB family